MIEMQRKALVQETRSAFQYAMDRRFIGAVERITNRRVARFVSTHHVGPDLELELFLLEPLAEGNGGDSVVVLEGSRRGSSVSAGAASD